MLSSIFLKKYVVGIHNISGILLRSELEVINTLQPINDQIWLFLLRNGFKS